MKFTECPLQGAYIIDVEPIADHRGFFGRLWCSDELARRGLETAIVQSNVGFSHTRGTLRGLHLQRPPHQEVKVIRCSRGAVYDVIVDLRADSPTYRQWVGVELSETNQRMIYVPRGFAQGYLTLEDHSEIYYHTSHAFERGSATGVRFDDPAFAIDWPEPVQLISDQDRGWADLDSRDDLRTLTTERAA